MNRLLLIDGVRGLRCLPTETVPMVLTSPPYDDLREYGGHLWDHESFALMAHELLRVIRPGGVLCWVVSDQIREGGQSGTSFRQATFFQRLGFRLHNTIIVEKQVTRGITPVRYGVAPEFVFVLSKGRPRTIRLIKDRQNKYAGRLFRYSTRDRDGLLSTTKLTRVEPFGARRNIWAYKAGGGMTTRDRYAFEHPATMPENLARDLIVSWSRLGDLVVDPMGGAGTSAKMALLTDRQYWSCEVHEPYHRIAVRRLAEAHAANVVRLDGVLGLA